MKTVGSTGGNPDHALNGPTPNRARQSAAVYTVMRNRGAILPDCGWEKQEWREVSPVVIDVPMGGVPSHRPVVRAKLLYDDEFLHVIFHVQDRFVRSVTRVAQGPVCTDSCVEFFFTPGHDVSAGYFNIETNCGGTALFKHQVARGIECRAMSAQDIADLAITCTMPLVVEPEIQEPVEWSVQYRVPYSLLRKYTAVTTPAPGEAWKANLYKCADLTSHPHWLTWSPVDRLRPDFHRPEYFGTVQFGG